MPVFLSPCTTTALTGCWVFDLTDSCSTRITTEHGWWNGVNLPNFFAPICSNQACSASGADDRQRHCNRWERCSLATISFGRWLKLATMSHAEDEGVGNFGAGITPRVFELLEYYKLHAAATWLLTGTIHFDRSPNSRTMPSWMPMSAKLKAAPDTDAFFHVFSNGDQYLSEYIKSPDHNIASTFPRPSDPTSLMCRENYLSQSWCGRRTNCCCWIIFKIGWGVVDQLYLERREQRTLKIEERQP